jgi:hypothetical protein
MKNNIRLLSLILIIIFIFSFTACTDNKTTTEAVEAKTTEVENTETIEDETTEDETIEDETIIIEEPSITSFELKGYDKLTITFTSVLESNIAVEGGFTDGDFTCTAKPGMKFAHVYFEITNNGNMAAELPYIGGLTSNDEMMVDNGDSYPLWSDGWAHKEEEYNRREATSEEIAKYLDNYLSLDTLPSEDTIKGNLIFEIPVGSIPSELFLIIDALNRDMKEVYNIVIPEEFIIKDDNLEEAKETASETTFSEEELINNLKEAIREIIEDVYQGRLTKCIISDDYQTFTISYNTRWASKDRVIKEMYDLTIVFSDTEEPINLNLSASTDSGDIYNSYTSSDNMTKIKNYEMSYEDWLEVAFN